ncbi:methyltransferase [Streptacidiphilus jiangxiensis]|uniref:O-methyltransferase n=1 Tax=Streptacidiphilus jiangxiensis TaxID=235985 RepID=A0A1H7MVI4_STRJI|nr:methyltransferase [Streptacidiphilus jiangxiensis]SEL14798.1 O-methyltransferase [Streptacidiphilus jiangxiensis]
MTDMADTVAALRLLGGFQLSQAAYVAARAGIADLLLDGPKPVAELAVAAGLRTEPLARIVRVLSGEGVFTFDPGTQLVGLGRLGRTFVTDAPESLRNIALMWMETHYLPFDELWGTVCDGVPAAERALGMPFFDWIGRDPALVALFTAAMRDFARAIRQGAIDAVDVGRAACVVDVGGADGAVLASVASRRPDLRGVVFDLPHVVTAAADVLRAGGLEDRVTTVGGDFFAEVPAGDCHLACFILHDWDDERAGRILDRIHEAASAPTARLLLVEIVLGEGSAHEVGSLLDLTMLGMLTGHERTSDDWRALLAAHGFHLDRIRPTGGPMCVLEATRISGADGSVPQG